MNSLRKALDTVFKVLWAKSALPRFLLLVMDSCVSLKILWDWLDSYFFPLKVHGIYFGSVCNKCRLQTCRSS